MNLWERTRRFVDVLKEAPKLSHRNLLRLHADLGIQPTPARVIHDEGAFQLLAFGPEEAPPVLIIPSLINRWYILDFLEDHSLVQALISGGLRVYILAWREAHDGMGSIPLSDYISSFIRRAVHHACRDAGVEQLTLLGQCLGGTFSLAYTARYPERVGRLITLTTPVDFSQKSVLGTWSRRDVIDVDKIAATYPGRIPNSITYGAFPLLDPRALLSRHRLLFQMIENAEFVRIYQALDLWTSDHLPIACGALVGITRDLYQENLLWEGAWIIDGRAARLEEISCPVFNVRAASDHIVPAPASEALAQKVDGLREFVSPMGHITLILASPLRAQTYAAIIEFCKEGLT